MEATRIEIPPIPGRQNDDPAPIFALPVDSENKAKKLKILSCGGGNLGGVITQLVFFTSAKYSFEEGFTNMGIMSIGCTLPLMLIYFPQWGGMIFPPSKDPEATEEKYYLAEWSEEDKAKGMHLMGLKFAENSRSERGKRKIPENAVSPGV